MMINCCSRIRFFTLVNICGLVLWVWQFKIKVNLSNTIERLKLLDDDTPTIITPLMLHLNRSFILDFIVELDPQRSRLSSFVLCGYRNNWKWNSINCYFHQSNTTTNCTIVEHVQEVMVRCNLPEFEQTTLTRNLRYFSIRLNIKSAESNVSLTLESPMVRVPV